MWLKLDTEYNIIKGSNYSPSLSLSLSLSLSFFLALFLSCLPSFFLSLLLTCFLSCFHSLSVENFLSFFLICFVLFLFLLSFSFLFTFSLSFFANSCLCLTRVCLIEWIKESESTVVYRFEFIILFPITKFLACFFFFALILAIMLSFLLAWFLDFFLCLLFSFQILTYVWIVFAWLTNGQKKVSTKVLYRCEFFWFFLPY